MKPESRLTRFPLYSRVAAAVALTSACLLMFACGGGGGDAGTAALAEPAVGSVATGSMVDAPVAGLAYESGPLRGFTDSNGNFSYVVGSPVVFKVGDIVVGSSTGSGVMTPMDFAGPGSNVDSPRVVSTVQFIKTIADEDVNGNLNIPAAVRTACVRKNINFDAPDAETQVFNVTNVVVPGRHFVTRDEARAHMRGSLNRLAAGTYRGTWNAPASVPSSGAFTVVINNSGAIAGVATLGSTSIAVTSSMTTTLVSGSVYKVSGTVSNGATWDGSINLARKTLTGKALYDGVDATFNAVRQ